MSAEKTINLLGPRSPWPARAPHALDVNSELEDAASGARFRPGRPSIVVSAVPEESAALADRLGRYLPIVLDPAEELAGGAAKAARAANATARRRVNDEDVARARAPWSAQLGGVDLSDVPLEEVRCAVLVQAANPAVLAEPCVKLSILLGQCPAKRPKIL